MNNASNTWTYCFLIPVYNHAALLERTIPRFLSFGIPLVIVDDGSDAENKVILKKIADGSANIVLIGNSQNNGN